MNKIYHRAKEFLYDTTIDINERLTTFFINIGIIAAILGTIVGLFEHAPAIGVICAALIAIGAPLIISFTTHIGHPTWRGSAIAIMTIFIIPIVWLTTGADSGGSGFWLVYELFYITLFIRNTHMAHYYILAIFVQAAAILADWIHPEWFFHFTDSTDALVSRLGTGAIVTVEILITIIVQKAIYLHEKEISTQSQDTTRNFVTSIANTIDTKDLYTGGHSRRVAECTAAIALRLGMSQAELDNVYFVALLHDIGKIGVPDRVLNKPGRLTDEEFDLIRKHPVYGAKILKDITNIPHVHDGVLYHHERYDGKGYPEGLKGEEIPFIARMISVADSYDAMSTNRIYRKRLDREDIICEMIRCRGTQFDPHIVDVFVEMLMEGFKIEESGQAEDMEEGFEGFSNVTAGGMMRSIMENEKQLKSQRGTSLVNNDEFINLYHYLRSLSLREGDEMILTSISLAADTEELKEQLPNCMVELNEAITENIRAVDVCTRSGESSFLILFLNAPRNHVGEIMERISKAFYSKPETRDIVIHHSIVEQ